MPRLLTFRSASVTVAVGLLAATGEPAVAQDAARDTLAATVTYLTAEYVYLDIGREQGIRNGDTLAVIGDGLLVVTGTASSRLLSVFASTPFPVAVGDTLRVVVRVSSPVDAVVSPPDDIVPAPSRSAIVSPADSRSRAVERRRRMRFGGRVRLQVSGVRSSDGGASGLFGSTARTYTSPSLSVRLAASDLPGGWDAVADVRLARRFASHSLVVPETQARIYRISLLNRSPASPFEIEAGRFALRQDASRSYWDGIRGGMGGRRLSFGVALGLDPDRYNGGIQTDVRKAAVYGTFSLSPGRLRTATVVSAAHVMPDNGWLDHTYVGLEQDIRIGDLSAGMEVVMDRDPERGGWATSRLDVRATVPLPAGVAVSGRYRERRPYAYWRTTEVLGTRRSQQSAALQWSHGNASAQVAWTVNTAAASVRSDAWTASVRHSDLAGGIGISASAGWWSRTGSESRHASLSLSRSMGAGRAAVQVRHFESANGSRSSRSEAVRLQLATPLAGRVRADGSAQYQFGSSAASLSFGFGLTWSF